MTATRSRKEEKTYKKDLHANMRPGCPFCEISPKSEQFVEEGVAFHVIRNIYPYSLWDGQGVVDHLMVVPKKHTDTLSDIKAREKAEYVDIISKYEGQGYDIYARAPKSAAKSVFHQHTHIIKLDGRHRRFVLLMRKPYIRILFR